MGRFVTDTQFDDAISCGARWYFDTKRERIKERWHGTRALRDENCRIVAVACPAIKRRSHKHVFFEGEIFYFNRTSQEVVIFLNDDVFQRHVVFLDALSEREII